jgi:hypothetical protein
MQTTTPLPYPDYPEFHEIFVNETFPTTTTTTPPPPSHKVFHNPATAPPPNLPYPYRHKRHTPKNSNTNDNNTFDNMDTYNNMSSGRDKRQILAGIAAAGGVLGTIFGLFNQMEMHSIQNHVSNLEASTNMLIHVQHKNQQQFKIIAAEMVHLSTIIETLIQYTPALVYAKLMFQVDDIADHLNNLLDTVQQLQHQKLSIRLLDLQQLNTLHKSLQRSAQQNNWQLLINNPQDIFQLDVSYIRKKSDVVIMVHVPCLTDNNLLTIYRYANLPLPIDTLQLAPQVNRSLNTLLPVHTINDIFTQFNSPASTAPTQEALYLLPEADLIAIGQNTGNSHRYKLLKHADLTACVQKNHIFLCEGHQVLNTDLEGSCLGSLYLQSERGVRENCKLERKPLRETVFQVSSTDHLVISPYPHTAQIFCQNGTHYPIRIRTMARLHLSPGCTLQLFNHTLRSDQSIRVKAEPSVFPWSFNPLLLPSKLMHRAQHTDDQVNLLKQSIQTLQDAGCKDDEIPQSITNSLSSVSVFSVLFWLALGIEVLALGLVTCWYCRARIQKRRSRPPGIAAKDLPMTISRIADLNLPDADGR